MSTVSTAGLSKESSGETYNLGPHCIAPNTAFSIYAKVEKTRFVQLVSQEFSLNYL